MGERARVAELEISDSRESRFNFLWGDRGSMADPYTHLIIGIGFKFQGLLQGIKGKPRGLYRVNAIVGLQSIIFEI